MPASLAEDIIAKVEHVDTKERLKATTNEAIAQGVSNLGLLKIG